MVIKSTNAVAVRIHEVSPESVAAARASASSANVAIVEAKSRDTVVINFLI